MDRTEFITRGDGRSVEPTADVSLRVFANGELGSQGLTTCAVTVQPGGGLGYHTHPTGESITIVRGEADVSVQGRCYRLGPLDSIHVPAGVAHAVRNQSAGEVVMHTAFPTGTVERAFVDDTFVATNRTETDDSTPETLIRFDGAKQYALSENMSACDLFAGRFGSAGMCGGYALFQPGASLPCHTHAYDESITIVGGRANCQVADKEYELADLDTVCIPQGRPHCFVNRGEQPMAMIWVYAGSEPDRTLVDSN